MKLFVLFSVGILIVSISVLGVLNSSTVKERFGFTSNKLQPNQTEQLSPTEFVEFPVVTESPDTSVPTSTKKMSDTVVPTEQPLAFTEISVFSLKFGAMSHENGFTYQEKYSCSSSVAAQVKSVEQQVIAVNKLYWDCYSVAGGEVVKSRGSCQGDSCAEQFNTNIKQANDKCLAESGASPVYAQYQGLLSSCSRVF